MDRNRPNRLDSWKEIADYVGRDVRTAIRWGKSKPQKLKFCRNSKPISRRPGIPV
jgi:hypothetical protein